MSEIKYDVLVKALKMLAQMDKQNYRRLIQRIALDNGGVNPVAISSSGAMGRERLRKNLAPELFRYMRRSGRFISSNRREIR